MTAARRACGISGTESKYMESTLAQEERCSCWVSDEVKSFKMPQSVAWKNGGKAKGVFGPLLASDSFLMPWTGKDVAVDDGTRQAGLM
jgi:hypothetical protein